MKTIFFFVFLLLLTNISIAQSHKLKRFEIEASAVFWTPYSSHLKASNEHFQFNLNNGASSSDVTFNGYGSTIAPALSFKYYINNYFGVSFGLKYMHLLNELSFADNKYTVYDVKNEGYIYHITVGLTGKVLDSSIVSLYYGAGADFVPYYYFTQGKQQFFELIPYHSDTAAAIGFYINAGLRLRIFKGISLNSGIEYSNIPIKIDYYNNLYSHTTKANLGGVSLNIGLSVNF